MALEQDIAELVTASNNLTQVVDDKIQQIDSKLSQKEAEVNAFITNAQKDFPLAPNNLSDTKYFDHLCKSVDIGTSVDMFTAHSSPWTSFLHDGTEGTGTMTKLDLNMLSDFDLSPNSEFNRALGSGNNGTYYGSNFRVLLLDIAITKPRTDSSIGYFFVLNQGCTSFTGWTRGEFNTQASCWINVLSQTGTIKFSPSANRSANITVSESDVGKGWQYKHAKRQGWGGCHQPKFYGLGTMKVAICLPYIGTGSHGSNNMIWADSVGHPYSHEAPRTIIEAE